MTGIFFDIDDTLYSRRDLLILAASETYRDMAGGGLPGETFLEAFYGLSDANFALVESGAITAWESNVWRFEKALLQMGLPCPTGAGDAFAERYTFLQNHITLSPLLERTFSDLSREGSGRLCLGVITNGPSAHQRRKFDMLGLERYIPRKYLVVSGEAGFSKPDEGIFRAAEKAMELPPEHLWIVGDSLRHDIEGARSAGWHTIWFDRSRDGHSRGAADITVHSEEELSGALEDTFLRVNSV